MENILQKNKTSAIKGMLAILVLLCHLRSYISTVDSNAFLHNLFVAFGYLSVAFFFFLSGYGLQRQYDSKVNYMTNFFRNRIFVFYIKYVIVVLAYSFLFLLSNLFSLKLFLKSFLFGGTIVINGWYFQTTLLLYLIFYLVYKSNLKNKILLMFIGILIYIFTCLLLNLDNHFYQSVFCFLFGILYAKYSNYIIPVLTKWYVIIVNLLLFSILIYFKSTLDLTGSINVIVVTFMSLNMISFVLHSKISNLINNLFLRKIGELSFEIYAVHGALITIFRSKFLFIENDIIFILFVLFFSFLFSWILHFAFNVCNMLKKG